MRVEVFLNLPDCAREIREKVFIDEQGFTVEFDDTDKTAAHLVAFDDNGTPAATCRIFRDNDFFVVGRLAVLKQYRGKNIGSLLLAEAERHAKQNGGKVIVLHAQQRVEDFYKKAGFMPFGDIEYDEGCPHVKMKKYL